jgi:hypothetical protein
VRAYTTKSVFLLRGFAALDKSRFSKDTIIGMDMLNGGVIGSSKFLIFDFGRKSLFGCF